MSPVIGQTEWNNGSSSHALLCNIEEWQGERRHIQNGWYHGACYADNFVLLTIVGFLLFWRLHDRTT
jgi:hypothetical protein